MGAHESAVPRIRAELERIEAEDGVRILLAVESGSRAWGFASRDSDFDVRFLYLRPHAWYLSVDLERRRDVIERPIVDELDINGWDLRKAMRLFHNSNPPLLEWLQCPIVYREHSSAASRLRGFLPRFFSPRSSWHHYLHMARGNFREYLRGETVWRKKYFYVLRPLLAIRWIEAGRGPVPIEFDRLVRATVTSSVVLAAIDELLEEKRAGVELNRGARIPPLGEFIESELGRLESAAPPVATPAASIAELNELFTETLDEVWPAP